MRNVVSFSEPRSLGPRKVVFIAEPHQLPPLNWNGSTYSRSAVIAVVRDISDPSGSNDETFGQNTTLFIPGTNEIESFLLALGDWLYGCLPTSVQHALESLDIGPIRLVVHEPPDSSTEALPWELLRIPNRRFDFIGLDPMISVLRYGGPDEPQEISDDINKPFLLGDTGEISIPFRLFAVAVQPKYKTSKDPRPVNLSETGDATVSAVLPRHTYKMAIRPGEQQRGYDLPEVTTTLIQYKPTVFYLMAHGSGPAVYLANENRERRPTDGVSLAKAIQASHVEAVQKGYEPVHLCLLSVCRAGEKTPHRGSQSKFAADISNGTSISWVIASASVLSVRSAQIFFSSLNQSLAKGGDIDTSISIARNALRSANDLSFLSLICYCHDPEAPVLRFVTNEESYPNPGAQQTRVKNNAFLKPIRWLTSLTSLFGYTTALLQYISHRILSAKAVNSLRSVGFIAVASVLVHLPPISTLWTPRSYLDYEEVSCLPSPVRHLKDGEEIYVLNEDTEPDFQRHCDNGEGRWCYMLASSYDEGEANVPEYASELYERACAGDEGIGCFEVAKDYRNGSAGRAHDHAKALHFFEIGCSKGHGDSCMEAYRAYKNGVLGEKDINTALKYLELGCKNGWNEACERLSIEYAESSSGNDINQHLSHEYVEAACNNGSGLSCGLLATWYETGTFGVPVSFEKSIHYWQLSCDSGNAFGCRGLGNAFETGRGIYPDMEKAVLAYQQSCTDEDYIGCDKLGEAYEIGLGSLPRDASKAVEIYQKACEKCDCMCDTLAGAHERGLGLLDVDLTKAFDLYKKACQAGTLMSCAKYASLGASHMGGILSEDEAYRVLLDACSEKHDSDHANVCAQLSLASAMGKRLINKDVVDELTQDCMSDDVAKSMPKCQTLAEIHALGAGPLPVNFSEAFGYIERACSRGNPLSCYKMGIMYIQGKGVEADSRRALSSFYEACEVGLDEFDPDFCKNLPSK